MTRLRRLARTALDRLRREESGFTLAELLMVITISSAIVLVIGAAFTAAAKASVDARTRLNESADARLLNTYFSADASGASYVSNGSTPVPAGNCAYTDLATASPAAIFTWTDAAGVKKSAYYLVVTDSATSKRLVRRFCSAGARQSDVTVVRYLSADPAKKPVLVVGASGSGGIPSSVALTVWERGNNGAYSYTVTSSPRGTDVLQTNDGAPVLRSMTPASATPSPSKRSQVQYQVLFSESVTGVDLGDFSVASSPTGATLASVIGVGGGTAYTVVVNTNSVGTGSNCNAATPATCTLTLFMKDDDSIKDRASKALNGAGVTAPVAGQVFSIDKIVPTVSLARTGTSPTSTLPQFTATFSEPVVGFDAGKVTLAGTAPGAAVNVTQTDATHYNLAITGLTGDGTVTASIAAGAVTDAAGNANTASTGSTNSVVYDTLNPTVVSITPIGANPTNAGSVSWTVTFSEAVTGVNATDFSLVKTGLGGTPAVTSVTGSGTTYTVVGSAGSGSGTLGLNLVDNDSILDQVLKPLAGAGNGSLTGAVFTVDRTAPTASLVKKTTQASPTGSQPVLFSATFNEPVAGFDNMDVTLGGTAASGATVAVTPAGTNSWEITVGGITQDGTITASIPAAAVTDTAGNANAASGTDTVIYDAQTPKVLSIVRGAANPTKAATVTWTVTFSEAVTGVDTGDFTLANSGLVAPSLSSVAGSGTTYTVTAASGTGTGTLGLNLVDNDTIVDGAAKKLGGTGTGNGNLTGEAYTVDRVAPTISGVQLLNKGSTVGRLEKGDQVVVTFSERLDVSNICSAWTDDGANQSLAGDNDVTVAVTNKGGAGDFDGVTVAAGSCTLRAGSVDLGATGFVSSTRTFGGSGTNKSTVAWDATAKTLTITLGAPSSSSGFSTVTTGTPVYTADPAMTDPAGNAVVPATSGVVGRF